VSVPETIHDFLVAAVNDATVKVSPFVRSHGTDFPFVIYDFQQDVYTGSTPSSPGPPLIQWEATVVDRTLLGAETIAQRIVTAAPGNSCPVRVKSLVRSYEPSYDGQRPGEYVITINMENF
jgi:hypothetical protein